MAQGEWLLFLHADTHLAPGWAAAVLRHLRDAPDRAGYFRLRFRAEGAAPWIVARWANFRARVLGLPYGDQGLLISRALYEFVGGYPEIALMEDVAFAEALKGRIQPLAGEAWTSARRYQRIGWMRQGTRNLLTLGRYFLGVDPQILARSYARGRSPADNDLTG